MDLEETDAEEHAEAEATEEHREEYTAAEDTVEEERHTGDETVSEV